MKNSRQTVFFQKHTEAALARRTSVRGKGVSTIINEIFRRFDAMAASADLPVFTPDEVERLDKLMTPEIIIASESLNGQLFAKIKNKVQAPLTKEINDNDRSLLKKLKGLTLTQQILLLDALGL